MLEIKKELFNKSTNVEILAEFIFQVQKKLGDSEEDQTVNIIKKNLEKIRDLYKFVLFYAYYEDQLVGVLLLSINWPKLGFIWDWQPIIKPGLNNKDIAYELIRNCIEFSKKKEIDRMEVCFTIKNERDKQRYNKYRKWYESLDFYKVMEEISMELALNENRIDKITFNEYLEIKTIKEIQISDLIECAYESFNDSKDIMYLDLNEEQKRITINEWFNLSKPLIEDASIVLTENERIAGFCITRPNIEGIQIGPYAITPSYRNRGLGKTLLLYCLIELAKNGFNNVVLDVAIENEIAYNLYSKLGFKKKFSTVIFALNF